MLTTRLSTARTQRGGLAVVRSPADGRQQHLAHDVPQSLPRPEVSPVISLLLPFRRRIELHQALPDVMFSITSGDLRMGKRSLRAAQCIAEARAWADELTLLEMAYPGEPLEQVWKRLETSTGVPFGTFWSLKWRHRQLKDVWGSIHSLLRESVEAKRAHKARLLLHQNDVKKLLAGQ